MSTDLREAMNDISPLDLMYLENYLRDRRTITEKLNDKNYWDTKYKEFLEDNEI